MQPERNRGRDGPGQSPGLPSCSQSRTQAALPHAPPWISPQTPPSHPRAKVSGLHSDWRSDRGLVTTASELSVMSLSNSGPAHQLSFHLRPLLLRARTLGSHLCASLARQAATSLQAGPTFSPSVFTASRHKQTPGPLSPKRSQRAETVTATPGCSWRRRNCPRQQPLPQPG